MYRSLVALSLLCAALTGHANAAILSPLPQWNPPLTYIINKNFSMAKWNVELFGNSNSGSLIYYKDDAGVTKHFLGAFVDPPWCRVLFIEKDMFSTGNTYFNSLGDFGTGVNQFKYPTTVKLVNYCDTRYNPPHYNGYYSIYVADKNNNRIEHYEYRFLPNVIPPYRANSMSRSSLYLPRDIDIDNNGEWLNNNTHILWATSELNCIVGFNMYAGTHLTTYEATGSGVGQFSDIRAIACGKRAQSHNNNNDTIYVADRGNARIVMLRWDGTMHWLGEWKADYAAFITDLAVDYNGCVWATTDHHNVLKFTSTLEPLGVFGQQGVGLDDLNEPLSICDGGGHAGWYNMMICERWSDESGIRYYVPSPEITDMFTQSVPQGGDCQVTISFNLAEYSNLLIEIYNSQNTRVRNLLPSGQTAQAGVQLFIWNGKDDAGVNVPSGNYRVKVTSTGFGLDADSNALQAIVENTATVCSQLACTWKVGDATGNGAYSISDAVKILNYIFAGGSAPSPNPVGSGDPNCSRAVNISDIVYIINYIFAGGSPPGNPDGVPPADCTCNDYQ